MKKVIIPSSSKPFVVDINGKKYTYQAGTEQEVPDDVAVIIEAYYEHHNAKPEVTNPPFSGGASSWNDLTDKPFGESDNAVLLPPTQFVGGLMEGALVAIGSVVEFVEGKTYTVNWNGTDYETVCFMGVSPVGGALVLAVGNPAAAGGTNNNQPFILSGDEFGLAAIPLDGSTAATVGITGYRIERIPEKYLPTQDQYIYETAINKFTEGADNQFFSYEPKLPLALLKAVYQRKPIYMKVLGVADDGVYNDAEYLAPVSVAGDYAYIAVGLAYADKTSEIFKIPEGTVINGAEVGTQQMLFNMGIRINTRFAYYVNKCIDFVVFFIDTTDMD